MINIRVYWDELECSLIIFTLKIIISNHFKSDVIRI